MRPSSTGRPRYMTDRVFFAGVTDVLLRWLGAA